jgi:hypothetical protein
MARTPPALLQQFSSNIPKTDESILIIHFLG